MNRFIPAPLNCFNSASSSLNDPLFFSPILSWDVVYNRQTGHPSPGRDACVGTVRSPPPPHPFLYSRDGTSRWEKVKWLRMSASLCTFPWWWTPDEDSSATRPKAAAVWSRMMSPWKWVPSAAARPLRRDGVLIGAGSAFAYEALMFVKCCVSAQLEQRCTVKNSSDRECRWDSGEAVHFCS